MFFYCQSLFHKEDVIRRRHDINVQKICLDKIKRGTGVIPICDEKYEERPGAQEACVFTVNLCFTKRM